MTTNYGSTVDRSNRQLARIVWELRQALDVYYGINFNTEPLGKREHGRDFFAYAQLMAHQMISLLICKIFETPTPRYPLNSIYGNIKRLERRVYTPAQLKAFERFGASYGNKNECKDVPLFLRHTTEIFYSDHKRAFRKIFYHRDKFIAHSEFGAKLKKVGSHDDYDAIFEYARAFYQLISSEAVGAGPALIPKNAGPALGRLLETLHVEKPQLEFPLKRKRRAAAGAPKVPAQP